MAGAGWHDFVPGEVLTAANVQDYLQDQAVMKFASAAARAAALPSPSQGMMSFLNDTGVVETYYQAWNATTNPGGKVAGAGWYATDRNDGLVAIVPPTVAVSGGSATANSLGVISFTSVTSISLNNVFSTKYNSYKILVGGGLISSTSFPILAMRMRNTGTDRTVGYQVYGFSFYGGTYANVSVQTSYGHIGPMTNYTINAAEITVLNPAIAKDTIWFANSFGASGNGNGYTSTGGYDTGGTYTADGFTLFPTFENMTGTVQIFGYNS